MIEGEEIHLILVVTVLFSLFYLYQINRMTFILCTTREIPEEKQTKIFTTVNILITILMLSFFVEVLLAV
ncbi:hypothetical protein [Sporosarcina jiandibaonis]|uniref:hypothetical protein n=1 Tax=Sporosarcina jiandibaonis TaxID=2715535 RepID=UPI003CCCBABC